MYKYFWVLLVAVGTVFIMGAIGEVTFSKWLLMTIGETFVAFGGAYAAINKIKDIFGNNEEMF